MTLAWKNLDGILATRQWVPMLSFAVRNWAASMLALYLAFCLQLESPYWAWVTVWIVAQPTPGMVLSKGAYRFIGTCAGALLGIILIALFAQTPLLFVLGLGLLAGSLTLASNLLRNFRAYATVLAAYTAGIIAAGAISQPDQVFFIAMARTSAIGLGIVSCIGVTTLFAPHRANQEVRKKLREILAEACTRAILPWQASEVDRLKLGSHLIAEIISLDTLIEYAAAESSEFRLQENNARSLLANLLGFISARRAMDEHLNRRGWPTNPAECRELSEIYRRVIDQLHEVRGHLDENKIPDLMASLKTLRAQVNEVTPETFVHSSRDLTSQRYLLDRLEDLLFCLEEALGDWHDIVHGIRDKRPRVILNFHRDQRAALINGLRAFLAIVATGTFWIVSAWPDGPNALVFVTILLTLFSSYPHPDRVGWMFFRVGFFAVIAAIFCKYCVINLNTTYEFLTASMGLFLIPLGLLMAHPRTGLAATSFSLVFLNLVAPTDPAVYNFSATLNTALAILVGVLFGTLSYQLIFPSDPQAARRYVTHRIRLGLQRMASLEPIPSTSDWETRMYDRVYRLYDPTNPSATSTDEWLFAGFGALIMGLEILRLRRLQATCELVPSLYGAVERLIEGFQRFSADSQQAVDEVRHQFELVLSMNLGILEPNRKTWARILGSLDEIQDFLLENPELLHE